MEECRLSYLYEPGTNVNIEEDYLLASKVFASFAALESG